MATLTGFTRPVQGDVSGNPVVSEDLRSWIASHTSLTITGVVINPSTIDVTGTIVSGDTSNIQTAINTYVYPIPTMPYIPSAYLSNVNPMLDDNSKVVTSHAALTSDNAVLAVANTKTANRTYINGVSQNGSALTGDIIEWIVTGTTSGGNLTFYVTSDTTSGGTPICSTLFPDSISTNFIDSSGVYAQGSPTITSNKTVGIPFTKQGFSGVTLLSTNLLGSVAMNAIPDGVTVKTRIVGIV